MRKGAGRRQGCSGGEAPEPGTVVGRSSLGAAEALAAGAFALGVALILAGAAPEGLAGF